MTATSTATKQSAATPEAHLPATHTAQRSITDRALSVVSFAVLAFLFAPIVVIVAYSFNDGRLLVAWEKFGMRPFLAIIDKPEIQNAVLVSIRTGAVAALLATFLGTLAGIAMARKPGRWVFWFGGLLLLVSVTPEIVDAVSLLPWFVSLGQDMHMTIFNSGFVRLVIGHSLFSTAVVAFIVRARLAGVDASLEDASADLYARPLTTFRRITLPLVSPAVIAGLLLSFTLSLDNTIIAAFVQVSGTTPWPVYVLSAVRSGLRPEIAAVSTIMLILTLLALGAVAVVLRRSGDSASQIARTMAGG
ncbi:ABC transporter permease [Mycolicibacterium sp. YH-1]|uniref:ABC transporter permease n=1 Tax=Mycolicibacterium sp. YH-1 TaxID=2908837 RepID=UPI001F4C1B51|nr:ABC transporter permease [Mycolicibacterium sp. YH-1]UNB54456.1 ABC transporter permease [Mycolicibacterium sp. YH-1]